MKLLSLDLSTKTGWAFFENTNLIDSGTLNKRSINDFNIKDFPDKSPIFPFNIIETAEFIAADIKELALRLRPDHIVIEQSVKGKNRWSQKFIEFMHFCVAKQIIELNIKFSYMDPSAWRSIGKVRLTNENKKHNALVSKGKAKNRINKKHVSVKRANELFGLSLKMKDNDRADALNLGWGYLLSQNLIQEVT